MPADAAARARVRSDFSHNLVVEAGAGTGKTTLLVDRAETAVRDRGVEPPQMALLTFTERAAAELRGRLADRLASGSEPVAAAARRLEAAPITTLHGLAYGLVRRYADRLGLREAEVWDAVETERQQELALLAWFREADGARRAALTAAAGGIDWRTWRRLVREWPQDPAAVPVGPMEAVTALVPAWADAMRALAEAASAAGVAADEPGRIQIEDLARQADALIALDPADWTAIVLSVGWGQEAGAQSRWGRAKDALRRQKDVLRAWKRRLEAFREAWMDSVAADLAACAQAYQAYWAAWKRERDAVSFDDQVRLALRLCRDDPDVRQALRDSVSLIMVDEFQDTDPSQVELVEWMAAVDDHGHIPPGRLVVVGDVKQAIYGFRGADVVNAQRWMERLVAEGRADLVHITENFRSRRGILEAVNGAFAGLFTGEAPHPAYVGLTGGRPDPPAAPPAVRRLPAPPETRADARRRQDAARIADLLCTAVAEGWPVAADAGAARPIRWGDMAVLLPRRTGFDVYREAMVLRGIPVLSHGGTGFYALPLVRGLAASLRAAMRPEDAPAVLAALRGPVFRMADRELGAHRAAGGTWHPLSPAADGPAAAALTVLGDWARRWTALGAIGVLVDALRRADPSTAEDWANADKLLDQAALYVARWGDGAFADWLWDRVVAGVPEAPASVSGLEGVELTSIHQAKGLEWPLVVVADLEGTGAHDGPLLVAPQSGDVAVQVGRLATHNRDAVRRALAAAREAEERRLWYVAWTRARDYLAVAEPLPAALALAAGRLADPR